MTVEKYRRTFNWPLATTTILTRHASLIYIYDVRKSKFINIIDFFIFYYKYLKTFVLFILRYSIQYILLLNLFQIDLNVRKYYIEFIFVLWVLNYNKGKCLITIKVCLITR